MPDSLTITREWLSMLEGLTDASFRRVVCSVASFAFDGTQTEDLNATEKVVFTSIRKTIKERERKTRYYRKQKQKPSNSPSKSPSNLDGKSVQFGRSETDDFLFNTVDSHGNLKKDNTIDSSKDLKENCVKESPRKNRKVFVPPTLEQVRQFAYERNSPADPEEFYAYHSANGWMIGRAKMVDWKRAFIYWERREFNMARRRNSPPPRDYSGI